MHRDRMIGLTLLFGLLLVALKVGARSVQPAEARQLPQPPVTLVSRAAPLLTHLLYLPYLAGGTGNAPPPPPPPPLANNANFFLPNKPGGSIVTTGQPQVAIDAAGGVHTVYAARFPDVSGTRPAYYSYCPSNCVDITHFTTLRMGDNLGHAQLALTASGQPRILLSSETSDFMDHYTYAACDSACTNPAHWTLTEVATGLSTGFSGVEQDQSFALDAFGRPRFIYMGDPFGMDPADAGTFYVWCDSNCTNVASWTRSKLTDDLWTNPALAFSPGPNSQPRVAVGETDFQTTIGYLTYYECNSACDSTDNWHGSALARTDENYYRTGAVYMLRIDGNGHPRIAIQPWQGYSSKINLGYLSYLACDVNCSLESNWTALDLGFPIMVGEEGVALALDVQNRPRIAYRIGGVTDEMAYTWCNSNCTASKADWHTQMVWTTALAQAEWPILAMQGCPSPECIPPIPPCTTAFWDAGYWPSLALDSAGNPVMAFDLKHEQSGGGCTAGSFVRWSRFASFPQPH